jgi:PhnB protein
MATKDPSIHLHPRLVVRGADDAIAHYTSVFDAELLERFTGPQDVVVHAALRIGASKISLTEAVPDWQLLDPTQIGGSPVLVHVTLPDPETVRDRLVVSNDRAREISRAS